MYQVKTGRQLQPDYRQHYLSLTARNVHSGQERVSYIPLSQGACYGGQYKTCFCMLVKHLVDLGRWVGIP